MLLSRRGGGITWGEREGILEEVMLDREEAICVHNRIWSWGRCLKLLLSQHE